MSDNFEYKEEYSYLTNICLNVTDACNLACRYCFVEQHPHFMSFQVAKDTVDWLYSNSQKKEKDGKCSINFFGGEPMLMYNEIIVPIVKYAEETYPNVFQFGITTNGTLVTEEVLQFFKNHNIGMLLSIDGNKETQDYNRPCRSGESSFDKINIPLILKYNPTITFRSTVYPDTVQNTFENYLFAEKMGFQSIFQIPTIRDQWTEEQLNTLLEEYKKIYNYRLNQLLNNIMPIRSSILEKYERKVFQNFIDKQDKEAKVNVLRCGLGTTSGSIGYDGNIYGCQEQTSHDLKNYFLIGNIYTGGINQDKHSKLLKRYSQQLHCEPKVDKTLCKSCQLYNFCTINDGCPSSQFDITQTFFERPDIYCIFEQNLYDYSLVNLIIYFSEPQQGNTFIKQYLQTIMQSR